MNGLRVANPVAAMNDFAWPHMMPVEQLFPQAAAIDIPAQVKHGLIEAGILAQIKPGATIALAVGSRGITNIKAIVAAVVAQLKAVGAKPFIIPAMGSHGGATPAGQIELLGEYGITETALGVPICAAMESVGIGETEDGVVVYSSTEALRAGGVILINRVKPHTDFSGDIGSGILKMMVVGLGKRVGAANFHTSAVRVGYERVIRTAAKVVMQKLPILGGVAVVENQHHETARLEVLPVADLESRENALFAEAVRLMPQLPFQEIDLLIVDRMGKNISGTGMDTNIIGRSVHGYSSLLSPTNARTPFIRRIFVRDLTPETHGNAVGIGLADVATTRLVKGIDELSTFTNTLTALTPLAAKTPIHFATDREAMEKALVSLAMTDLREAKVVRIQDTLSLAHFLASEACRTELTQQPVPTKCGASEAIQFAADGNLMPLRF